MRRTAYPEGYTLLRERRYELGLTLRQVEAECGVEYTRLSRMERGDGADEDTWKTVAGALGLRFEPARVWLVSDVCADCGMDLTLQQWQIDWVIAHGNPVPRPPCPVNASGLHRVEKGV